MTYNTNYLDELGELNQPIWMKYRSRNHESILFMDLMTFYMRSEQILHIGAFHSIHGDTIMRCHYK